ncbi:MAG TPA: KEOPS complex subunit Pcc1 [Nitrososphaeraceae archaeon]|jgi:hypothetical protein|nr:KEOPS complex subunit Pcc1 [Nitrososphaeraceae archaeon]
MKRSQIPLEITAVIELNFSNKSELNAVMKALIPDNINFPNGLQMNMFSNDNTLHLDFICDNVGIGTLASTIDEILEHISIAEKVILSD